MQMSLGERIVYARKHSPIQKWRTAKAFAEHLHVHPNDLSRLESDKTDNPHWLRICAIAEATGASLDWLRGRTEEPFLSQDLA